MDQLAKLLLAALQSEEGAIVARAQVGDSGKFITFVIDILDIDEGKEVDPLKALEAPGDKSQYN